MNPTKQRASLMIPLTGGGFATVDESDFDWLNQWTWGNRNNYAVRNTWIGDKQKKISMHREIAKTPNDMDTDHINGDSLDNRRSNLRICTTQENCRNRKKITPHTSKYKGVSWHKATKKWAAQIGMKNIKRKTIWLGIYDTPEAAALVYNNAALKYHGNFSAINVF